MADPRWRMIIGNVPKLNLFFHAYIVNVILTWKAACNSSNFIDIYIYIYIRFSSSNGEI